jgi:hypothetical protein
MKTDKTKQTVGALPEKALVEKLIEALKCAEMVLAERGIELKEITRALANYGSVK